MPRFSLNDFLLKALPKNPTGDRIYSYISFYNLHKRLPSDRMVFNDVLYRIKTTEEIVNPLRVFVSDKEFVKLYVKSVLGDGFNIPTLAVLKSPEAVDEYTFPARCCIKPTHASGHIVLRLENEPVDRDYIKTWFSINYYEIGREANYRQLIPKVIVEPLLFDSTSLLDYKFFCYNGKPGLIQVDFGRRTEHMRKYFNDRWEEQDFSLKLKRAPGQLEKPANLPMMLEAASRLSHGFNFVRVDLYSNGTDCYVGEITNCHGNVTETFIPPEAEETASRMIFG